MQIPSQIPDLQQPLTQRLETAPVRPVAPTPGVADQVKALDSRLALQWTQPVFEQDAPALARFLQTRSLLIHESRQGRADRQPVTPEWPTVGTRQPQQGSTERQAVQQVLQQLYQGLQQSPVFAASHLLQVFQGKRPNELAEEAIQRWAPSISADHPAVEQATDMLLTGTMRWQGEWTTGVPLIIERQDAWRENQAAPGELQKGAALHVQVDLPKVGRMNLVAQQWPGEAVQVQIQVPSQMLNLLQVQSDALQSWVQAHGVTLAWSASDDPQTPTLNP